MSVSATEVFPKHLWFILGLGFILKGIYLFFNQQSPYYEPLILDPLYYHQWALRILRGDFVGEGVFYGLPLYPFFLALCYKLFHQSLLAVKIAQGLLGLATVFFVYKIGEEVDSKKTGFLAAFLAVFYGPLFFHESIFIPEVLGVPLYAASFYAACVFMRGPTLKKGIALGVLSGLAALTKAGIVPFILLFTLILALRQMRSGPKKLVPILGVLFSFLTILAPVTAHNMFYGKDTVLLTSHGGFNFYIGNNPKAEGVFLAPEGTGSNVEAQIEDSKAVAEREWGRSLKPSEVSRYWSDKARKFIKENPGDFLKLCFRKLVLFFDAREISDVEDYFFSKNFNPVLRFPWINFAALGPIFFLGLVVSFKRLRHQRLLYLWIFSYVASVVIFFVNARYRLPLLSVFFVVAAAGVLDFYEKIK